MYAVFFDYNKETIRLPVNPSAITVRYRSRNKKTELVELGEASVLKSPGLAEYSFKFLLPKTDYPFIHISNGFKEPFFYLERFRLYMTQKKPVRFIVNRELPDGSVIFETNTEVSVEDFSFEERAGQEGDFWVEIKLKEYKPFRSEVVTVDLPDIPDYSEDFYSEYYYEIHLEPERAKKEIPDTYKVTGDNETPSSIAKEQLNAGYKYDNILTINGLSNASLYVAGLTNGNNSVSENKNNSTHVVLVSGNSGSSRSGSTGSSSVDSSGYTVVQEGVKADRQNAGRADFIPKGTVLQLKGDVLPKQNNNLALAKAMFYESEQSYLN